MSQVYLVRDYSKESNFDNFQIVYSNNTLVTLVEDFGKLPAINISQGQNLVLKSIDLSDSKLEEYKSRLRANKISTEQYDLVFSEANNNSDDAEWVKNSISSAFSD